MKILKLFVASLSLVSFSFGGDMPGIQSMDQFLFMGRWSHEAAGSCASAPAVNVQFNANAKWVSLDLEGLARWRFDIDGKQVAEFRTDERTVKKLGAAGDGKEHLYRLIKISESNPGEVCLHGITLDETGTFGAKPKMANRRIEFIGDSFTVGFGSEGSNTDPAELEFEKTNASKSYAFLLADGFRAEFQVNAVSGRGLVRNYANIVPGWTLEKLYDYTVAGTASTDKVNNKWNISDFDPQVIVLFMGINDFQGEPPYGDKAEFKKAYARFLQRLREAHPGVKFLLVSTRVWPNDDLTPTVQEVFEAEKAAGHKDVEFKLLKTENIGLLGHPDVRAHQDMANTLRPIIAKMGGWLNR